MAMNSSMDKGVLLQKIGVSSEDAKRYLDIDCKLASYCKENDVKEPFGDSGAALTAEDMVRELMARGFLPHRTAVDEIKASVARELEEERRFMRDHIASAQKEINVQLLSIRHNLQLQQFGILQRQPPRQLTEDIKAEKTDPQQLPLSHKRQYHQTHREDSKGEDNVDPEYQDLEQRAALDSVGALPAETDDETEQIEQAFDLSADLLWFREQVQLLQEEQKQYRLEMRRQEQQHLLQQRVSVSKLELQEELARTKDEILNSVKALWAFTEVEFNDSTKLLQKETKDAFREMLSDNQNVVKSTVSKTKEVVSAILSENLKPSIQATVCEMKEKQECNHRQITENISQFKSSMDNLQLVTVGQIQRFIDKIRDPSHEDRCIFYFLVEKFQGLIGSSRTVMSFPCAFDSVNTLAILRGAAYFNNVTKEMTVGLTCTPNPNELGLQVGKPSALEIKARIKSQTNANQPTIEVGAITIICGADLNEDGSMRFVQIGDPVACEQLVSSGYNTFIGNSVLIEFEVTLVRQPGQKSVLSSIVDRFK